MDNQPVVFFELQPADTAPKDGSRFLALIDISYYSQVRDEFVSAGNAWADVWYTGDKFDHWRGSKRIRTTNSPDIIGWIPLPGIKGGTDV